MNNTIKNEWLFDYIDKTFEEAEDGIRQAICLYNRARPHQALGMKTPMQMLPGEHPSPLCYAAPPEQHNKGFYNKNQKTFVCQPNQV